MDDWDEAHQLYQRGRDEMDSGNLALAVEFFQQSSALSAHYKTQLLLGDCLKQLGRNPEAVVAYAAATTLNQQGIAPFKLAELMLELGEPDEAKYLLDLAIARQPELRRARVLVPKVESAIAERKQRFNNERDTEDLGGL